MHPPEHLSSVVSTILDPHPCHYQHRPKRGTERHAAALHQGQFLGIARKKSFQWLEFLPAQTKEPGVDATHLSTLVIRQAKKHTMQQQQHPEYRYQNSASNDDEDDDIDQFFLPGGILDPDLSESSLSPTRGDDEDAEFRRRRFMVLPSDLRTDILRYTPSSSSSLLSVGQARMAHPLSSPPPASSSIAPTTTTTALRRYELSHGTSSDCNKIVSSSNNNNLVVSILLSPTDSVVKDNNSTIDRLNPWHADATAGVEIPSSAESSILSASNVQKDNGNTKILTTNAVHNMSESYCELQGRQPRTTTTSNRNIESSSAMGWLSPPQTTAAEPQQPSLTPSVVLEPKISFPSHQSKSGGGGGSSFISTSSGDGSSVMTPPPGFEALRTFHSSSTALQKDEYDALTPLEYPSFDVKQQGQRSSFDFPSQCTEESSSRHPKELEGYGHENAKGDNTVQCSANINPNIDEIASETRDSSDSKSCGLIADKSHSPYTQSTKPWIRTRRRTTVEKKGSNYQTREHVKCQQPKTDDLLQNDDDNLGDCKSSQNYELSYRSEDCKSALKSKTTTLTATDSANYVSKSIDENVDESCTEAPTIVNPFEPSSVSSTSFKTTNDDNQNQEIKRRRRKHSPVCGGTNDTTHPRTLLLAATLNVSPSLEENDTSCNISLSKERQCTQLMDTQSSQQNDLTDSSSSMPAENPIWHMWGILVSLTQLSIISAAYALVVGSWMRRCFTHTWSAFLLSRKVGCIGASGLAKIIHYGWKESALENLFFSPPRRVAWTDRGRFTPLQCYVCCALIPGVCDTIMQHADVPHFTPHIITTVAFYWLCNTCDFEPDSSFHPRGKIPNNTASTHHHQDSKNSDTSLRWEQYLSLSFLLACRISLLLLFIWEGFSRDNSSFMLWTMSFRMIIAYLLSVTKKGMVLSPVAWIGWSVQYLLATYFLPGTSSTGTSTSIRTGYVCSCILDAWLFIFGLAVLRLVDVLKVERINREINQS